MARHKIDYLALEDITPADSNAKAHDEELMGASFNEFGFIESMVMDDRTNKLVSGHGRREKLIAAHAAGETPPDGIVVKGKQWLAPVERGFASRDDDHAIAAGIALNRIGQRGGWNFDLLLPDLEKLNTIDALGAIGFGPDDLADLRTMMGSPESLSELRTRLGKAKDDDFWPVLHLSVSPEVKADWDALTAELDIEDTSERVAEIIKLAHRGNDATYPDRNA